MQPAATLPVTLIMLEAVRDFREATGQMVGVKPAGGIRTSKDAIKYLVMVNEVAGPEWLDPDWFRFGASHAAQRPAHAAHEDDHRPLLRPRLLHPGLTVSTSSTSGRKSNADAFRVRTCSRVAQRRRHQAVVRPVHQR